jgi:hypothetical protein
LYWHKCQCWQVAQHECKFRICSIRCLESCRLDMPINCLRKMEKATSSVNTLTAAFSKSCLVTVFICLTLFCRGAVLSWRSFVAALILRLSFVARSFVARSNVVDSSDSRGSWVLSKLSLDGMLIETEIESWKGESCWSPVGTVKIF